MMDYRSTIHVEFQAETFTENTRLRDKIAEAVKHVLEFHGLKGGLDVDAYRGDVEITKGWARDEPAPEQGVSHQAESDRINQLIDDFEADGEKFERWFTVDEDVPDLVDRVNERLEENAIRHKAYLARRREPQQGK